MYRGLYRRNGSDMYTWLLLCLLYSTPSLSFPVLLYGLVSWIFLPRPPLVSPFFSLHFCLMESVGFRELVLFQHNIIEGDLVPPAASPSHTCSRNCYTFHAKVIIHIVTFCVFSASSDGDLSGVRSASKCTIHQFPGRTNRALSSATLGTFCVGDVL